MCARVWWWWDVMPGSCQSPTFRNGFSPFTLGSQHGTWAISPVVLLPAELSHRVLAAPLKTRSLATHRTPVGSIDHLLKSLPYLKGKHIPLKQLQAYFGSSYFLCS